MNYTRMNQTPHNVIFLVFSSLFQRVAGDFLVLEEVRHYYNLNAVVHVA